MTDNSLMPFGKYKDKKMIDVPASYLKFIYDNDMLCKNNELREYIKDNMDVIEKEIKENQKESQNGR